MKLTTRQTVYLVYGFDNYEYPCDPIKAFLSRDEADDLLGKISSYADRKPDFPFDDCTDEEYDAWSRKFQRWCERHPAGDAYSHDGFAVMQLELSGRRTPESK